MQDGSVLSTKQVIEFGTAVLQHLPLDSLTREDYDYWIANKKKLTPVLKKALIRPQPEKVAPKIVFHGKSLVNLGKIGFWSEMWKYLDWELNTKGLFIPAHQDEFDWFIASPLGLMPNKAYNLCEKKFRCWRNSHDLDQVIVHNDRDSRKDAYVIRVRDRIEADEEYANWSANKLQEQQIACITLTERLVLELAVFLISGQHLDVQNLTLCAGSRNTNGSVPSACWHDSRFKVYWDDPDYAHGNLRVRHVVVS